MKGQTASDDLESLFYIFVEFVTIYDGLHGKIIYLKTEQWAGLLEDLGTRAVTYKSGLLLVVKHNELMDCTTAYFGNSSISFKSGASSFSRHLKKVARVALIMRRS